jgi:hypothetical protein
MGPLCFEMTIMSRHTVRGGKFRTKKSGLKIQCVIYCLCPQQMGKADIFSCLWASARKHDIGWSRPWWEVLQCVPILWQQEWLPSELHPWGLHTGRPGWLGILARQTCRTVADNVWGSGWSNLTSAIPYQTWCA